MNKEREYDEEGMRYCTEAVTLTESTEQRIGEYNWEPLQKNIDLYLVFVPLCPYFFFFFLPAMPVGV